MLRQEGWTRWPTEVPSNPYHSVILWFCDLQYIDDIIVWGYTAEEAFEKGEKIVQILLKAGFAMKRSKVTGPAQEIQFLGIKWQDGRRQIPMDVINKIAAMSPPTSKKEAEAFLGVVLLVGQMYSQKAWLSCQSSGCFPGAV